MPKRASRKGSGTRRDVLIVGGGLIGTATALELARRGHLVRVLDKAIPGAEASSAAAGILGAEIENTTESSMLDLCRKSRRLYPGWVRELQAESRVDVGFLDGGALEIFPGVRPRNHRAKERAFQITAGRAALCDRKGLQELEPELGVPARAGLFFEGERRITPAQLYRAVRVAADRAGVRFIEGSLVKCVTLTSAPSGRQRASGVLLDDGSHLAAEATVVAAGSWTSLVEGLPLPQAAVVPARGQLVELTSAVPLLSRLVFGEGVYLIPRADGRLLVGSTLEFVGFSKGVTAAGLASLLNAAARLVPALGQAEVSRSWSNFRPYTHDHLPLLGSAGVDDLVIASGHYRNGILLAPITAQIVARLVEGKRPPLSLKPFDPRRQPKGG